MKYLKFKILLTTVFILLFSYSAFANEESQGYIVKLSSDAITLFSNRSEGITHLGDSYYKAESLQAVYEEFSAEDIEKVIPDYKLELFETEYPYTTSDEKIDKQWNLDLVSAYAGREKGIFGKGVKIAVIDSGLRRDHTDLNQAKIMQGYNCIDNATDKQDTSDNYGHGTNVCGIIASQTDNQKHIAGIASESYIIPLKITDGKSLTLSSIYNGIEKAIELECDIINLSLGGALTDQDAISEFKAWIDKAYNAGIIIIAAVGNSGTTALNYPAAFDNVIGVGSVKSNKTFSSKSQYNESVFLVAPGESVITLSRKGGTATNTGTSFAAPHVTAAVALIKELKPDCTLDEIKQILRTTSEDLGEVGYDHYYGHGLLNIKGILESLDEYIPDIVVSQGIKDETKRIHIHNNTGQAITADGFFVKYNSDGLPNLRALTKLNPKAGVTTESFEDAYVWFMLWDNKLTPYIKKTALE